jgi:hypothetical protein
MYKRGCYNNVPSDYPLLDGLLDGLHAAVDAQLLEDIGNMEFDRPETDDQFFCDLVIVQPFHHPFEHVALPLGQFITRQMGLRIGIGKDFYSVILP